MKINNGLRTKILTAFKGVLDDRIENVRRFFANAGCLEILESTVAQYCALRGIKGESGDVLSDVKARLEVSSFCEKAFVELLQSVAERENHDCANN